MERARGKAEVIIGKVCNGAISSIVLAFDEKTLSFATVVNDVGSSQTSTRRSLEARRGRQLRLSWLTGLP